MLRNLRHCSYAVFNSDFFSRNASHVFSVRMELMKAEDVLPKSASIRSRVAILGLETKSTSSKKNGKSSLLSSERSKRRTSRSSNSSVRAKLLDFKCDQSGA